MLQQHREKCFGILKRYIKYKLCISDVVSDRVRGAASVAAYRGLKGRRKPVSMIMWCGAVGGEGEEVSTGSFW